MNWPTFYDRIWWHFASNMESYGKHTQPVLSKIVLTWSLNRQTDHCIPQRNGSQSAINAKAVLSHALLKPSLHCQNWLLPNTYAVQYMCFWAHPSTSPISHFRQDWFPRHLLNCLPEGPIVCSYHLGNQYICFTIPWRYLSSLNYQNNFEIGINGKLCSAFLSPGTHNFLVVGLNNCKIPSHYLGVKWETVLFLTVMICLFKCMRESNSSLRNVYTGAAIHTEDICTTAATTA